MIGVEAETRKERTMRNFRLDAGLLILAALATAACGGNAPTATNATAEAPTANEVAVANYQAEVIKLPVAAQEGVFLRAVRDAGLACQSVTKSERMEDRQGNPTWRATCDGNNPHLISITRDGTAKIVSRTDAPRG
jgi:hypothetical protein